MLACVIVLHMLHVHRLQVLPGHLFIPSWNDSVRSYTQLRISCNASELTGLMAQRLTLDPRSMDAASTGYQLPPPLQLPPPMACAVGQVNDWAHVVEASLLWQQVAREVHIILHNNISVYSSINRDSNGTILVYRDMKVCDGG